MNKVIFFNLKINFNSKLKISIYLQCIVIITVDVNRSDMGKVYRSQAGSGADFPKILSRVD